MLDVASILVGGSFPLKLPIAVVALVPVGVISVDLADLVLG
jgi:hypothetical protein